MNPYQGQSSLRRNEQQNGRHYDSTAPNEAAMLSDAFNHLSLATGSTTSLPDNAYSSRIAERDQFNSRHASPSRATSKQPLGLRKTPSTTSLRDDRRASTPSLQKKLSTSSLRSSHNVGTPLSRRASSNNLSSPTTNMRPKSPLGRQSNGSTQKAVPTAASIASDHFKKELELHRLIDTQSKTIVIIHDACYGHRFSRPRTSKAALSTIVERPERIQASILGLSTAYVRMGQRHEGGRFAPHPDLDLRLLPTPPFQIRKTDRSMAINSPAVTHVHGTKWMEELKTMCHAAGDRLALNGKELVRPRSSGKDGSGADGHKLHEGDLYLCPESLNAFEGALGGVCEAVDSVFGGSSTRRAFVCVRPPGHHCSANDPSGFCWLNNVHVGIAHGAMNHGLTHAAILDFDLHHGDGSQAIAWEQNRKAFTAKNAAQHKKTAIGYFSLHDINSYPCEMGDEAKVRNASVCIDNAHGQSVWNVHLESWKTPAEFWKLYNDKYSILLQKAREFLRHHTQRLLNSPNGPAPRAAIFLSAGFDASEWEGAGMQRHKVNVPTDFYARFTADVVRIAEAEGLGADGRVVSVLEGGYSDRALTSGILSHVSGLADVSGNTTNVSEANGLASEMYNRLALDNHTGSIEPNSGYDNPTFDSDWWRLPLLEELELLANPPPPPALKKAREKPASTYSSPTQSFKAKIITPTRDRKSFSSQFGSSDSIALPPPLPDVDWATAAHELSKLIIPTDRQTLSCRHDELSVDTNRARHERASAAIPELPANDGKRMQLRERKPKVSTPVQTPSRPASRAKSARRTTIADVADLPDPSMVKSSPNARGGSRRLSAVSAVAGSTSSKPSERTTTRPASKPQSAAPSRPASAVGVKKGDALANKPRVTSGSRAPTAKTRSSPRKTPPVPPVPSHLDSTSSKPSSIPEFAKSDSHAGQSKPLSANEQTRNQDLDTLATDVKKLSIKLKVPSPEENAAREKQAAEERKKARASRPGLPKRSTASGSNTKSRNTPVATPELQKDDPTQDIKMSGFSQTQPLPEGRSLPTPGPTPPSLPAQPFQQPSNSVMSPPQTPGLYQQVPHPQITIKSPPSSVRPTKEDLPHFTPTSAIPFAPATAPGQPPYYQQANDSRPVSPHSHS
ncbi:hypothetical protein FQN54_002258 [Arachnomyces sp. PD_36]|nr:hypothetical protein FQN54_002258 [Arachnomyces sp. PD_36]